MFTIEASGRSGPAAYAATFSEGDAHTSFGARGWPREAARRLQTHLDTRAGDAAFKKGLEACTKGIGPAALVGALDDAMRGGLPAAGAGAGSTASPPGGVKTNDLAPVDGFRAPMLSRFYFGLLPWLWAALLVGLLVGLLTGLRSANRLDLLTVGGLTLLALGLRVMVAEGGPGDIFNNMAGTDAGRQPEVFGYYGRGAPAILWLLQDLGLPPTDALRMHLSLAAGVASISFLYALTLSLRRSRVEATLAAGMLTLLPLHVHFSATYHRYAIFVALGLAALLFLHRFVRVEAADRERSWDAVAGVAALALAVQCRPESVAFVGIVGALFGVLALRRELDWRRAGIVALGVVLLAAYPVVSTLQVALRDAADIYTSADRPLFDPSHNAWLNAGLSPWSWAALSVATLLVVRREERLVVGWMLTAALGWTFLTCTMEAGREYLIYNRHQLGAAPFYVMLAAVAGRRLVELLDRRWAAVAVAMLLIASLSPLRKVTAPATLQAEYAFYRDALPKVPAGCLVAAYETGHDSGLRRPLELGHELGVDRDAWVNEVPAKGCVAYIHTSNCSTFPEAETAERRTLLCGLKDAPGFEPVLVRELVNAPTSAPVFVERKKPIPVGLYLRR